MTEKNLEYNNVTRAIEYLEEALEASENNYVPYWRVVGALTEIKAIKEPHPNGYCIVCGKIWNLCATCHLVDGKCSCKMYNYCCDYFMNYHHRTKILY